MSSVNTLVHDASRYKNSLHPGGGDGDLVAARPHGLGFRWCWGHHPTNHSQKKSDTLASLWAAGQGRAKTLTTATGVGTPNHL